MSQFAVYRNRNPRTCRVFPLLVDVQADLLEDLRTRVVVPLLRAPAPGAFPMTHLTPSVTFEGLGYILVTPQLAGIARAHLGTHAGSVANDWKVIWNALEFLVRGC